MEPGIDEAPTVRSLDEVRIHDRETSDGKWDGDAPYARRDEVAQRAMGPDRVTLGTMEVSGPFV
jgi:hypothetical protein